MEQFMLFRTNTNSHIFAQNLPAYLNNLTDCLTLMFTLNIMINEKIKTGGKANGKHSRTRTHMYNTHLWTFRNSIRLDFGAQRKNNW